MLSAEISFSFSEALFASLDLPFFSSLQPFLLSQLGLFCRFPSCFPFSIQFPLRCHPSQCLYRMQIYSRLPFRLLVQRFHSAPNRSRSLTIYSDCLRFHRRNQSRHHSNGAYLPIRYSVPFYLVTYLLCKCHLSFQKVTLASPSKSFIKVLLDFIFALFRVTAYFDLASLEPSSMTFTFETFQNLMSLAPSPTDKQIRRSNTSSRSTGTPLL